MLCTALYNRGVCHCVSQARPAWFVCDAGSGVASVSVHLSNEAYLAENLEKLGNSALNRDQQPEIGES